MRFFNHHPSQRCHVRFFLPCAVTDTQEFHLTFVVHRLRGAPLLAGRGSEDHGGSPILCVLRQRQREEQEKKQERGHQELHDLYTKDVRDQEQDAMQEYTGDLTCRRARLSICGVTAVDSTLQTLYPSAPAVDAATSGYSPVPAASE